MRLELRRDEIYETCPEGGSFALWAEVLDEGYVSWFDLTHSRCFDVTEVLLDSADEFRWRDRFGRVFWLRVLTLLHPDRRHFPGPPESLTDFKAAIMRAVESHYG